MTVQLKPCPFCFSPWVRYLKSDGFVNERIICDGGNRSFLGFGEEDWNRRTPSPDVLGKK